MASPNVLNLGLSYRRRRGMTRIKTSSSSGGWSVLKTGTHLFPGSEASGSVEKNVPISASYGFDIFFKATDAPSLTRTASMTYALNSYALKRIDGYKWL